MLAGCAVAADVPAAKPSAPAVFRPIAQTAATAVPTAPALVVRDASEVLRELVCWHDDPARATSCLPPGEETLLALQRVSRSGDPRFIAPLVDMLWLDVGWERWVREALEAVSGQRFATPAEWHAWMTANPPPLPPGYPQWKGRLLSIVDARFAGLVRDRNEGSVRPEQLVWGLFGVNALPPLRDPKVLGAGEQRYLGAKDVVYGVLVEGEARAYPERILGWHGVVEDTVNGRRVLVVHCAPCGGATVFGAQASDGRRYTLGGSGLVAESRRLLVDEETRSLWDALTGAAVSGPLAMREVRLPVQHALRTTWGVWAARYPQTRVLSLETGVVRDYAEGAALKADREVSGPQFPVSRLDGRLSPKTRVLGISIEGARRAYPLDAVERARIVHDRIGGRPVVLLSPGPGLGVTVYDADGLTVERLEGDAADRDAVDSTGQRWFVNDERLLNARNSRTRPALPAQVAYWFAWAGAYPDTSVWQP